jgi:branched-chain amino acid transport system permease protein
VSVVSPEASAESRGAKPGRGGIRRLTEIRPAWLGVLLLGLATLYFTTSGSAYHIYTYDTFLFACMGAISLQILQGTTGLVSLGNPAFLITGAFGTVFARNHGVPFPLDVVAGVVLSGLAGLLVGVPAIRLRALFLALSTLAAFFLSVFVAERYLQSFPVEAQTGFIVPILFSKHGILGSDQRWAWLLFIAVALVILGASRIMAERSGRALRMIRDHEHLAPAIGISVTRYKLILFTVTSMVIGLQGGLTAYFTGVVSTDNFTITIAFEYIAMIVIGGLDSIAGAVIGAALVIGLPVWIPSLVSPLVGSSKAADYGPNLALIVYGLLVVVCVTSSPEGVVGFLRVVRRRIEAMGWTRASKSQEGSADDSLGRAA